MPLPMKRKANTKYSTTKELSLDLLTTDRPRHLGQITTADVACWMRIKEEINGLNKGEVEAKKGLTLYVNKVLQ